MGCGAATGRVAPEMTEGQYFRETRVSGPKVCVDKAVRNGEFAPARTRGEKAKSSLQSNSDNFASVVASQQQLCNDPTIEPPSRTCSEVAKPMMPEGVVDGSDAVDLDDANLRDLVSSWEICGRRPGLPPKLDLAAPPTRKRHEEYIRSLNYYREEVSTHPHLVVQEVDEKRGDHERLLDYLDFMDGQLPEVELR